jgi:hypothetical protein
LRIANCKIQIGNLRLTTGPVQARRAKSRIGPQWQKARQSSVFCHSPHRGPNREMASCGAFSGKSADFGVWAELWPPVVRPRCPARGAHATPLAGQEFAQHGLHCALRVLHSHAALQRVPPTHLATPFRQSPELGEGQKARTVKCISTMPPPLRPSIEMAEGVEKCSGH